MIAERIKNEQLWKQLQSATAINLPQLLTNPVIEALRGKRSALQSDYQDKLQTFKPGYPVMVQLKSQIDEIDRQLAIEVKTLKDSYKAAYDISVEAGSGNKERIESLKQDVLKSAEPQYRVQHLKAGDRYQSSALRWPVGAVQGRGRCRRRRSQQRFHRRQSDVAWGAILADSLAGAAHLAGVRDCGALGVAFVLERLDDTLRSPEELERVLGYPTLGIIPKIAMNTTLEKELADPRSHMSEAYRSLCTALAAFHRQGLAENVAGHKRGPGGGKIDDMRDARPALCQCRAKSASGRCGFAQAVAAQKAEPR